VAEQVRYRQEDGLAVLTLARRPGNPVVRALRAALMEALDAAEADPGTRAVLIESALPNFCTGDSLAPGEDPRAEPDLAALCLRIERFPHPVVAALQGLVLGGGLELALSAHYRVALPDTRLGLPAITLGLPPAGGGVQRLVRTVPAGRALEMLLGGTPMPAGKAAQRGLIDRIGTSPLDPAARGYARELMAGGAPPRPAGSVPGFAARAGEVLEAAGRAREKVAGSRLAAAGRIVDCVEAAAMMPYEAALAFEAEAFADCRESPETQAMIHVARAERQASAATNRAPALTRLGIYGDGMPAAELAALALKSGVAVTILGSDGASASAARDLVLGALDPERPGAGGLGRLSLAADPADLDVVDAVVLASDTGARGLAASVEAVRVLAPLGLPVLTLTAPASVGAIAAAAGGGEDLMGLSLGAPGGSGRMAELVAAPDTEDAVRQAGHGLARALGRFALEAGGAPLGPVIAAAGRRAAEFLVQHGVAFERVAGALGTAGYPKRLLQGLPAGGEGDLSEIGAGEILDRVQAAMANAGARLLSQGRAARPADIDLAAVHGQGFPRWLGGPMFTADAHGLFETERQLTRFAEDSDSLWAPDPLFRDLVKNGRRLEDLNASGA
jgi:3-hydroxyacyl-CoA dehydrogenase